MLKTVEIYIKRTSEEEIQKLFDNEYTDFFNSMMYKFVHDEDIQTDVTDTYKTNIVDKFIAEKDNGFKLVIDIGAEKQSHVSISFRNLLFLNSIRMIEFRWGKRKKYSIELKITVTTSQRGIIAELRHNNWNPESLTNIFKYDTIILENDKIYMSNVYKIHSAIEQETFTKAFKTSVIRYMKPYFDSLCYYNGEKIMASFDGSNFDWKTPIPVLVSADSKYPPQKYYKKIAYLSLGSTSRFGSLSDEDFFVIKDGNIKPIRCNKITVSINDYSEVNPFEKYGVVTSGLISPFWLALHDRIDFMVSKGRFEYLLPSLMIQQVDFFEVLKDPMKYAEKLGNRIVIRRYKDNTYSVELVYEKNILFEKVIKEQAKFIMRAYEIFEECKQSIFSEALFKKKIADMTYRSIQEWKIKYNPDYKVPTTEKEEESHSLVLQDEDYWIFRSCLSDKEKAYYGWQNDPQ